MCLSRFLFEKQKEISGLHAQQNRQAKTKQPSTQPKKNTVRAY